MHISTIIPVYNEEKNISELNKKLVNVLESLNINYEIIYVDDGSYDGSFNVLKELAFNNKRIKIINFVKNYGQTLAISAGIEHSKGEILVFMDADLQNDPQDIPKLLNKLEEGYDVVIGWRKQRLDPFFTRIVPSYIGNKLVSLVTGLKIHDIGCGLRVFRRSVIKEIKLYGEMHRLLPIYAKINGTNIAEVAVTHNSRISGKSNYGLSRIIKLLLDLINIMFVQRFYTKPLYFLGSIGIFFTLSGLFLGSFILVRKIFLGGIWLSPLMFISIMLFSTGTQIIVSGILAELLIRVYYKAQQEYPYIINCIVEDATIKKV